MITVVSESLSARVELFLFFVCQSVPHVPENGVIRKSLKLAVHGMTSYV